MSNTMLFYKSIVPLNRQSHAGLHLNTEVQRFAFAQGAHLIPAVVDEFAIGGRALPIVFVPSAGLPQPAFLTGLRSGENLCLDSDANWSGDYVPAYVRRYPFMMGEVAGAEPLICIDEASSLLGDQGEPLFADDGADNAILAEAARLVTDYKEAAVRTDDFVRTLLDLGLFQSINIDVKIGEGETRTLHGLLTVDETALNGLSSDKFARLREKNQLTFIYAHLFSLIAVEQLRRIIAV